MKKLLFVTTILFLSCAFAPSKKIKVIFFGDSITELAVKEKPYRGYILELEDKCKAENKSDQYDFIGSGISANKVYDLYLRLEDDVLSKNPDVVFIWVGVNDVYLAILKKLKDRNIKAVLVTPAVVGEKTDMSNPLDGDLNKYCNIIRDIAKKNDLPLVDLRKEFGNYYKTNNPNNEEKNILTYDKVHLNTKGNQFVADLMWKAVKGL